VLQGVFQDSTAPPADVSPTDLNAEADAFVTSEGVTDLADAQIVVASQTGTCFGDGFAGDPSGCSSTPAAYCAWHTNSSLGETFTNLPYQLDAGPNCGENFINVAGKCMNIQGARTANGTQLVLSSCTAKANQVWSIP
jgi:hypothetical protein